MSRSVLVVDDEPTLRETLAEALEQDGLRVVTAADGREALEVFRSESPDLVLLDLMLPQISGIEVCRIMRRESAAPIVMLTAKDSEIDKVVGLELGADDYVPKPFNPRELLARVKSVLRRVRSLPENLKPEEVRGYRFAGWTLDLATRNLTSPAGVVIALSGTEFRLLHTFLAHPNRVLTRDQLIDLMLSRDAAPFDRAIDVQVSRLRHRLGDDAKEPEIIKTVRSQGYVFAAHVDTVR